MSLRVGDPQRIGGYWLAGRLGEGGQGVVYDAYDETGGRVAIKVLRAGGRADPQLRGRFAKEVAATQKVSSFCTARVIEAHPEASPPYIVSEFVHGPTLKQAVTTAGPYHGDGLHRLATATTVHALSPDGRMRADVNENEVRVWEAGTRELLHTFTTTGKAAFAASLSPDGTRLATAAGDGLRLWDLASGKQVGAAFGDASYLEHAEKLEFGPSGRLLVVSDGGELPQGQLWDVDSRQRILPPTTLTYLDVVALSVDDRAVISGIPPTGVSDTGPTTELWDLRTRTRVPAPWLSQGGSFPMAFSPDGRTLVSTTFDQARTEWRAELWDVASGRRSAGNLTRSRSIPRFAFSADGRFLASSDDESARVTLWRVSDRRELARYPLSGLGSVTPRFGPEDRTLRLLGDWGSVLTLDIEAYTHPLLSGAPGHDAVFSPDGRVMAVEGRGEVRLWDTTLRRPLGDPIRVPGEDLTGGDLARAAATFSKDRKTLVVGYGTMVSVWQVSTRRMLASFPYSEKKPRTDAAVSPYQYDGIEELALSPDGRTLAATFYLTCAECTGPLGALAIWDLPSGRPIRLIENRNVARGNRPDLPYREVCPATGTSAGA
ncbi:hypothetical protein OIE13_04750 [Streptosporangium sp. NBC_01810]|uniref:WD40 repeat domain-containing protein n=1 Tax=Streptosporangium sp. NBC_01810 TaxID=2975951 RepID=UPI002DDB0066|nr:hypothetical protein [Streptosporangium sp. NBC_01810]WSA27194.1 hypothetical protein OIE13_04750 [Streptosporangium sp. NBC_01810]